MAKPEPPAAKPRRLFAEWIGAILAALVIGAVSAAYLGFMIGMALNAAGDAEPNILN